MNNSSAFNTHRTLNIALVRASYNPFGGAEKFVVSAVDALADTGAKLTIITRSWPAAQGRPEDSRNTSISKHIINPKYFTSVGRERGFAAAVSQYIATANYDLVQSHERIIGCDVYRAGDGVHAQWLRHRVAAQTALARAAVKLNPLHRYLLSTERAMFESPKLQRVICNSEMVRQEILANFKIPAEKLTLIYSGVDTQKFNPSLRDQYRNSMRQTLQIAEDARVCLFVGSGFMRKGVGALLQALQKLPNHFYAVVVGEDKHRSRYQALAQQLSLANRVRFVGGITDVRPYYGAADLLVLPTLYDPFPNVCLEAMASGLPVITSTTSGAAELIESARNGYVCNALDFSMLAQQIEACAQNLAHAQQMGGAARQTVAPFTLEAMAQQYVALYKSLLHAKTS
jgi:UDP-glucose:(heptosyl)LPS alpha-1,3-glucosyltransferase